MMLPSESWSLTQVLQYFGPRVFFAIVCGGVIGLERELKSKPAGIKTNMLICLGSTLYTSVSILMSMSHSEAGHYGDPSRIAAQIVSGIGFLGGGSIIQARGTITGLTTAATIWVVAAIGVCIGMGHPEVGMFASVSVIIMLVATTTFEDRILGRSLPFICVVVADDPNGQIRTAINQALIQNDLMLDDFNVAMQDQRTILTVHYNGHRNDHKKFILEIWSIPGIREVRHQ